MKISAVRGEGSKPKREVKITEPTSFEAVSILTTVAKTLAPWVKFNEKASAAPSRLTEKKTSNNASFWLVGWCCAVPLRLQPCPLPQTQTVKRSYGGFETDACLSRLRRNEKHRLRTHALCVKRAARRQDQRAQEHGHGPDAVPAGREPAGQHGGAPACVRLHRRLQLPRVRTSVRSSVPRTSISVVAYVCSTWYVDGPFELTTARTEEGGCTQPRGDPR